MFPLFVRTLFASASIALTVAMVAAAAPVTVVGPSAAMHTATRAAS